MADVRGHVSKDYLRSGEDFGLAVVPDGYEVIVFDQQGHVRFLKSADGQAFQDDGTGSYNYDPGDIGAPKVKDAEGSPAVLDGMTDATFILNGVFTPDGSGLAVAFTNGPNGWGLIAKTSPTELEVSTAPPSETSGPQTSYRTLAFSRGSLLIKACPVQVTTAQCGAPGTLETASWRWTGTGFRLTE